MKPWQLAFLIILMILVGCYATYNIGFSNGRIVGYGEGYGQGYAFGHGMCPEPPNNSPDWPDGYTTFDLVRCYDFELHDTLEMRNCTGDGIWNYTRSFNATTYLRPPNFTWGLGE